MKRTGTIIVQGIIFSLFPAVFAYLGQSNNAFDYLIEKNFLGSGIPVPFCKEICFIISIILTFFLLTVNLINSQLREEKYKKQSNMLLKYNKSIFIETLVSHFGKEYSEFDIRIFVPRKTVYWMLLHRIIKNIKYEFVIKNVDALADSGKTDNLKFEVSPNTVGLVGACYSQHDMFYDDDLENSNSINYNLNGYQISKTNDLKFSLVCPIYSDCDEIIAIIALDSKNEVKIPTDKHLKDILIKTIFNYTRHLYENVPDLFKAQGGII